MSRKTDVLVIRVTGYLLALPLVLLTFIFKVAAGTTQSERTANFARTESGGRFRAVTADEVYAAVAPIEAMVIEVATLQRRSGVLSVPEANRLERDAHLLAARIEAACDEYEAKNFSFAHRRQSKLYRRIITNARGVASDLRKTAVRQI